MAAAYRVGKGGNGREINGVDDVERKDLGEHADATEARGDDDDNVNGRVLGAGVRQVGEEGAQLACHIREVHAPLESRSASGW